MFVEAHAVGSDDWTTLPDANGHTATGTGDSCAEGSTELHPFLEPLPWARTASRPAPPARGTRRPAAPTAGRTWSIDLSAYAGKQVEVSISYMSATGARRVSASSSTTCASTVDGAPVAQTSFETDLGGWTVAGSARRLGPNSNDWTRSQQAFDEGAVVTTDDTVYLGFGAEGLTTEGMRHDIVARAMQHLLG